MTDREGEGSGAAPPSLAGAQRLLLEAVLTDGTLPGTDAPARLPDLRMITGRPPVLLAAEHLADPAVVEGLPVAVQVQPEAELRAGGDRPHLAYLAFGPPVWEGDTLRLVLHGRVVPAAGQHPLGLSGIQVRLRPSAAAGRSRLRRHSSRPDRGRDRRPGREPSLDDHDGQWCRDVCDGRHTDAVTGGTVEAGRTC